MGHVDLGDIFSMLLGSVMEDVEVEDILHSL